MEEKKFSVEQIEFKDDGLKAIRALTGMSEIRYHSWQEKKLAEQNHARKVLHMLRKIGLSSFLKEAWRSQDLSICEQFVRNWNSETKTTYVSGTRIQASFHRFISITSRCLPDVGTQLDASKISTSFGNRTLSLFSPAPDRMPKGGLMLDHCKQTTLKAVLKVLNMTLWAKTSRHHRVSGDLLYLVLQAEEGTKLNWKKLFYDKFLWEMARLKALLQLQDQNRVRIPRLQTVLGPVMCYMYNKRHRK